LAGPAAWTAATLETLLDEYWEARQLGAAGWNTLRQALPSSLYAMALPQAHQERRIRP